MEEPLSEIRFRRFIFLDHLSVAIVAVGMKFIGKRLKSLLKSRIPSLSALVENKTQCDLISAT